MDFDPVIDNALAAGNAIPDEFKERAEIRQGLGDERKPLPDDIRRLFPSEFEQTEEMGWIPKGWTERRIDKVLELVYGKALKKTARNPGNVPVYGSGGIIGFHDKYLVEGPGIIIGRKGTVGSLNWEDQNFFPIDTVFYVKPKDNFSLEYIFYLIKTLSLQNMNTDAAVPGLNRNNVYRLMVTGHPINLVKAYTKVVNAFTSKISGNINESNFLMDTRDSLLPKLLSGEVRIDRQNKLWRIDYE